MCFILRFLHWNVHNKKKKKKGTNSNQNKTGRRHVPGKIAQRFMMSYLLCVSYPLVSFRSRNSSFFLNRLFILNKHWHMPVFIVRPAWRKGTFRLLNFDVRLVFPK